MKTPIFLIFITFFAILIISTLTSPGFAAFDEKISNYHIKNAIKDTSASNVVTSIIWDYRAYDTLGEETILFAGTLGIYAMFHNYVRKKVKVK